MRVSSSIFDNRKRMLNNLDNEGIGGLCGCHFYM